MSIFNEVIPVNRWWWSNAHKCTCD